MASTQTDRLYGENSAVAIKAPVVAVTNGANLPLTGLTAVGTYVPSEGDRILVKDQADPTQNGIYNASQSAWQRSGDFDGAYDVVQGTLVVAYFGNGQASVYQLTTANPIIGTSALTFVPFWNATTIGQTAAEAAAGVVPTNTSYWPGDVRRYGAVGDGVTDDSAAFARAALVCGTIPMLIPHTAAGYKIVTPFVLPANPTIIGQGRPLLFATVNGLGICSATGIGEVSVTGVRFQGTSASTNPLTGFGGYSANDTGLFTAANCTDVRVVDCEFSTFYNGVSILGSQRAWVQRNRVSTFQYTGVLLSECGSYDVEFNDISNCTQAGGAVAYGVQASGDVEAGFSGAQNSISFNRISGIPSWAGIETHDSDGLRVIGNDVRNVRQGIAIGHLQSTNICRSATVADNYVEGATTDTWGGAAAEIGGILIEGFGEGWSGTGSLAANVFTVVSTTTGAPQVGMALQGNNVPVGTKILSGAGSAWTVNTSSAVATEAMTAYALVDGCSVVGNTIRGVFGVSGMVGGGFGAGCIAIVHSADVKVADNTILEGGNASPTLPPQSTGIYAFGLCQRLSITGNTLSGGSYVRGAIRLNSVTADVVTIADNQGEQTTTANAHVQITASTIAALSVGRNPTNSASPYSDDQPTSTIGFVGASPRFPVTLTLSGGTTTNPQGIAIAQITDDLVTLELPSLTAASNAVTQPILSGLPASLMPADTQHCIGLCQDNSATQISQIRVDSAGGTLTLFIGSGSAFTAAGTKGVVNSTITYRRAA